jgi:hypothetical protein
MDNAPGGTNTAPDSLNADGKDWGQLSLNVDNDWIAVELERRRVLAGAASIPDTDLNFDGSVTAADATIFIANWRSRNLVSGIQVGDWNSRQKGDFNYDGITNLADAFLIHEALFAGGSGTGLDFAALGSSVPEPASWALIMMGMLAIGIRKRRG